MFKEIIQDFKEYGIFLKKWIFYKRHSIKMSLAIRLADIKQKAFNRQYHVMLIALPSGDRLTSINREDVKILVRKKWLPKDTTYFGLTHSDSVFYSTPISRNNKSTPEERKEAREKYLKYVKKSA